MAPLRRRLVISRFDSNVGRILRMAIAMLIAGFLLSLCANKDGRQTVVDEIDEGLARVKIGFTKIESFGKSDHVGSGDAPSVGETVTLEVTASATGVGGVGCLATNGANVCDLFAAGDHTCGSNMFPIGTVLELPGYGRCMVRNRLGKKSSHRLNIYVGNAASIAKTWGVQRLPVKRLDVTPKPYDEQRLEFLILQAENYPERCPKGWKFVAPNHCTQIK